MQKIEWKIMMQFTYFKDKQRDLEDGKALKKKTVWWYNILEWFMALIIVSHCA